MIITIVSMLWIILYLNEIVMILFIYYCDNNNDNVIKYDLQELTSPTVVWFMNIYYKLNDDSKENVWSILQALLQLTIEYCEIKNIKY